MSKVRSLRLAAPAAVMAIVFSAASQADDRTGALQAKIAYCKTCHGSSGQGYHGYYTIPRLAGQQTEYFLNQLRAFVEHRRENRYMYSVAHVLNPSMLTGLAGHFNSLNPKPMGGGPKELVATGKKIYEEGIPEANVPACMACHGADAKGHGEIPRLAGQLPDYVLNKLLNWDRERGQGHANPDASALMLPTSHSLTKTQIVSIAAYVSYLQ